MASFEEIQETLALLKILAMGNAEVAAGKLKPIAQVFETLHTKVPSKKQARSQKSQTTPR